MCVCDKAETYSYSVVSFKMSQFPFSVSSERCSGVPRPRAYMNGTEVTIMQHNVPVNMMFIHTFYITNRGTK